MRANWAESMGTRVSAVASEAAMDNARWATQVHGGYGFMNDCAVGRFYRDAKVLEIGEGTSEVQRMLIARDLGLDQSQLHAPRSREQSRVQGSAPNHHDLRLLATGQDGSLGRGHHLGPRCLIGRIPTDDDMAATRQQPGQRLPGLAAHDHRVPRGERAEVAQVFGQPPRQAVAIADHAVGGDRRDERERHRGGCRPDVA